MPGIVASTQPAALRAEAPDGQGYIVIPTSQGRTPRDDRPAAPVEAPESPQPRAGEPSIIVTGPPPVSRPSVVVTGPPSTGRPSISVTGPPSYSRPSISVTGPPPESPANPTPSSQQGGIGRTALNSVNSVMRGAVSERYQGIADAPPAACPA